MEVLKGRPVADRIDRELDTLSSNLGELQLGVYLVGGDESSEMYARSKIRKGEKVGVKVHLRKFPENIEQVEIEKSLERDASDQDITGIMIERPLPEGFDLDRLMSIVPPVKDVEGLHPENYGLMAFGRPRFIPPTPLGALLLMNHYSVELQGKRVVIVGRSPNVGRPLATILSQKRSWANATVTLVHSRTRNISHHTQNADVVITAVGNAGMITADMINKGVKLIDLGINPKGDTIVGDVDMASVEKVAGAATPTPGGTGPVTVSAMFLNLFRARMLQVGNRKGFNDHFLNEVYGPIGGD